MESFAGIRFVLVYTLFLNLIVTVAKIAVGYITGSLSIIADGFDSLFDGLSNIIGLVAIYLARRPPDEDHPYGHRRYEILMTLVVAVLLFLTCYGILKSAYQRFLHPTVPDITWWSFASLLLSIGVHLYTVVYESRRGKELKSEFLIADAAHTRADILVTLGVMGGLIVVRMGYVWVDAIMAVIVALLIAKIGVDIIHSSARILTDAAAVETAKVAAIIQRIPGVESYHQIRSRGQEDDIYLDLHIRVAPDIPLAQAHMIGHRVERKLEQTIEGVRDVVVHVEPQPETANTGSNDVLEQVRQVAYESGVSIHHVNALEIAGRYSVDLHLEVPNGLTLGEAHAQATSLEDKIKGRILEVAEIYTHIEPTPLTSTNGDDVEAEPQMAQTLHALACDVPGVHGCHDLKVRQIDNQLFLTLHCVLDRQLPVAQAHNISTVIEEHMRQAYPEIASVSVHVEPSTPDTSS